MNINYPKVSIVTACFNSVTVIEESINSVLRQTYPQIEYIIIDGGSTDGTTAIIKKYEDRINFWISEPDKGIANAWNKGLTRCTGEVIGFLNADDMYTAHAVETAINVLVNNPDAGFTFGDVDMCDPGGNPLYRQIGDPAYKESIIYDMPSIPHPTVFVRREVYDRYGGFDETYKTALDYEFLLRITVNGVSGKYIPQVLVNMRLGGESDRNYVSGYREVVRASVKYGYPHLLAALRYKYKCTKGAVRRIFERTKLDFIVRMFRERLGRRYKYRSR